MLENVPHEWHECLLIFQPPIHVYIYINVRASICRCNICQYSSESSIKMPKNSLPITIFLFWKKIKQMWKKIIWWLWLTCNIYETSSKAPTVSKVYESWSSQKLHISLRIQRRHQHFATSTTSYIYIFVNYPFYRGNKRGLKDVISFALFNRVLKTFRFMPWLHAFALNNWHFQFEMRLMIVQMSAWGGGWLEEPDLDGFTRIYWGETERRTINAIYR